MFIDKLDNTYTIVKFVQGKFKYDLLLQYSPDPRRHPSNPTPAAHGHHPVTTATATIIRGTSVINTFVTVRVIYHITRSFGISSPERFPHVTARAAVLTIIPLVIGGLFLVVRILPGAQGLVVAVITAVGFVGARTLRAICPVAGPPPGRISALDVVGGGALLGPQSLTLVAIRRLTVDDVLLVTKRNGAGSLDRRVRIPAVVRIGNGLVHS